MAAIPICAENYPRNEIVKDKTQQIEKKLNECKDELSKIHDDEQINKMEMEKNDTEPKVIPTRRKYGCRK